MGSIGILRLLAPTPQQAQTRCLLGAPFSLVAQDDRRRVFSVISRPEPAPKPKGGQFSSRWSTSASALAVGMGEALLCAILSRILIASR